MIFVRSKLTPIRRLWMRLKIFEKTKTIMKLLSILFLSSKFKANCDVTLMLVTLQPSRLQHSAKCPKNETKNIFSLSAKDFDDRERCLKLQSYHKFIHSHTDCIKKSEYATFRWCNYICANIFRQTPLCFKLQTFLCRKYEYYQSADSKIFEK